MFGKLLFSLQKFSLVRGAIVATASTAYSAYDVAKYKRQGLSISEMGPDEAQLQRHEQLKEKLIKLNDGDPNIPEIRYMESGFQDNGGYVKLLNIIILPKTGDVNDFVLAHEFAHWKLGHGSGAVEFGAASLALGIIGCSPVQSSVPWILGTCVVLLPKYFKHGTLLARGDLDENAADKFAIEKGFAKEGYEYFSKMDDNVVDADHPLASHRTAQCYMKWKEQEQPVGIFDWIIRGIKLGYK